MRENDNLKRMRGQQPQRGIGYGGGQYGAGAGGGNGQGSKTGHPFQLSIQDKVAITCKDWCVFLNSLLLIRIKYFLYRNNAGGCSRSTGGFCFNNGKKLKHGCSKVDGSKICWDSDHKESDHA